jgi:DNA-binding response OmpR family regulator
MERSNHHELKPLMAADPRRVLVVGADTAFTSVLCSHLALDGYAPLIYGARQALRDLPKLRAHTLLLDFDGPGVDGYDLLAGIQAPLLETLNVVVFSRHPEPVGLERTSLRELGVRTWLQRPCSLDDVSRALERAADGVRRR